MKAEKAIETLSFAMTTEASVIRAGGSLRLPAAELVPSDMENIDGGCEQGIQGEQKQSQPFPRMQINTSQDLAWSFIDLKSTHRVNRS